MGVVGGGGCHGRAITGRCLIDGVVENGKVRMQVVSTSLVAVENTCYKYCGMQRKINYYKNPFVLRGVQCTTPIFCGPTMSGEERCPIRRLMLFCSCSRRVPA